jgi:hypothetical protein
VWARRVAISFARGRRIVGEVAPGDPDRPVAGDLQRAVAGAVVFEGLARAVGGEPVELGDQPVGGPEAVDGSRLVPQTRASREVGLVRRRFTPCG